MKKKKKNGMTRAVAVEEYKISLEQKFFFAIAQKLILLYFFTVEKVKPETNRRNETKKNFLFIVNIYFAFVVCS